MALTRETVDAEKMTTIIALLPDYERFLRHELQRADQTVTAYLSDLRGLSSALDKPVEEIVKNDLRAYMRARGEQGISRATVRRSIGGMSTFWKWMIDEGYVSVNATSGIVLPKVERKFARWLSEVELRRFVETPDNPPRNILAWKLLAWLALRRDELLGLLCEDVMLNESVIIVRNTKGLTDRTLPIPNVLYEELGTAALSRPMDAYLLPGAMGGYWDHRSFYLAFNRHCKAAGVSGITPHTLRHTFATHMSQQGVPLRVIQKWLGHKRIDTTSIYLQVAPEFMSEALAKHILNDVQK